MILQRQLGGAQVARGALYCPIGPQRCPGESGIIAAGFVTAFTGSGWPVLVLGLGIALMNADAAREIYQLAREEHRAILPEIFPMESSRCR